MMNFRLTDKRIKVGDQYFDSIVELKRYNDLLDLEESGAISGLARKVKFELVADKMEMETRTANGVRIPGSRVVENGLVFKADFFYQTAAGMNVAEVRRGACKSLEMKKTLMLWKYRAMVMEY